MLGLLPAIVLALATVLCRRRARGWRDAALLAALAVAVGLALFTELASAFGALTRPTLAVGWGAAALALTVGVRARGTPAPRIVRPSREVTLLVAATALLVAFVGASGLLGAPNNYDSLTYHLPRVMHWAQHGSIDHYPTWIDRQLHSGPFAEWVILHLYVLTGSDRLANAVQWVALLLTVLGASAVAERVGADSTGQAWAALFVATLPPAVLQGQSTQNDLVVAAWLACAGAFGLDVACGRADRITVAAWGAGLGLAALTKGTAFTLGVGVVLFPAVALVMRHGRRATLPTAAAAALALALNVGHWSRNVDTFGHPLLPAHVVEFYRVEAPGPTALVSNLVRYGASHLGTPWPTVNSALERAVHGAHDALGLDPDDPRTTFPRARFSVPRWEAHEDVVAPSAHLAIALVAFLVVSTAGRRRPARCVALTVLSGLVAMAVLVKWQPWHTRLTLPLFAGAGAVVGVVLPALVGVAARSALALGLLVHAGHVVLFNASRRWIEDPITTTGSLWLDRTAQYFTNAPYHEVPLRGAAEWLRAHDATHVGLVAGMNDPCYPLWVLLPGVRIDTFCPFPDVVAQEPSLAGATSLEPAPRFVVTLHRSLDERLRGEGWERAWSKRDVAVWERR